MIVTYYPSPNVILAKQQNFKYLISLENRLFYIEKFNPDFLVLINFTKQFSSKTASEFLELLIYKFKVKGFLLGFNHCFGKNQEGNFEFLKKNQVYYGYELFQMPPISYKNNAISSSLIKKSIQKGQIQRANKMLGKYFFIEGKVQRGEMKGRQMNFPTVNLHQDSNFIYPPIGVYVGKIEVEPNLYFNCMINIGTKPTFTNSDKILIEAHILNFNRDLYDKIVKIFFYYKIREEKKFKSITHLKKQLIKDKKLILELLN